MFMKVGRPPIIKNAEELQRKFNKYIKDCEKKGEYANISGFCYSVGAYRDYLAQLENDKPDIYYNTIKRIREFFANYTIKHGQKSEKNQALNIFLLKNYGYHDRQEVEHSGNVGLTSLFNDIDKDQDNDQED